MVPERRLVVFELFSLVEFPFRPRVETFSRGSEDSQL